MADSVTQLHVDYCESRGHGDVWVTGCMPPEPRRLAINLHVCLHMWVQPVHMVTVAGPGLSAGTHAHPRVFMWPQSAPRWPQLSSCRAVTSCLCLEVAVTTNLIVLVC